MGELIERGLCRQVAVAVRTGMRLDAIEETIIAPAPVDAEQKAALWLYAEALEARRSESMLISGERPLTQA